GELIFDNCHPNLTGHEVIASALLALMQRELHVPFDRGRDLAPADGRRQLGLAEYGSATARAAEALHLGKLALKSGVVNEAWQQAEESCRAALEADPAAWEVLGMQGLLEAVAGKAGARALIEKAMEHDPYVKVSYVFFWRTQPPFQRALAAAGID